MIYVMRVTGALTFNQYWIAPHFQNKKPNLRGSKKQAFGDNIYFRDPRTRKWHQANSHHSHQDGSVNLANVNNDTQTDRMLFSDDFAYWGGSGPEIPARFLSYGEERANLCAGRNHKNQFPMELVSEFVGWFRSLNAAGYSGEPVDWCRTP